MKRVYVAGKLNGPACEYIQNMHKMIKYGVAIKNMGFSIFVPCLDILLGIFAGSFTYEDFFKNNVTWLEVADILFVLPGWETSPGTKKEIEVARGFGIPVVFTLVDLYKLRKEE